jgi:plastocyanin
MDAYPQTCLASICVALVPFAFPRESGRIPTPTGTIAGFVRYTGDVPPPREITTTDGRTLYHNNLVVHPRTKGLRYMVAVLENAPAQPKVQKAEPVVVDQRDMVFNPRVVAVQHGQAVRFENNDLSNHGVTAYGRAAADQFNLYVGQNRSLEHLFSTQKTPIAIGCPLHAWMRAWVYVVPHPWFAISEASGKFTIEKIPPGKYTLWMRHADTGQQERRSVQVEAGKVTEVTVEWRKVGRRWSSIGTGAGLCAKAGRPRHNGSRTQPHESAETWRAAFFIAGSCRGLSLSSHRPCPPRVNIRLRLCALQNSLASWGGAQAWTNIYRQGVRLTWRARLCAVPRDASGELNARWAALRSLRCLRFDLEAASIWRISPDTGAHQRTGRHCLPKEVAPCA